MIERAVREVIGARGAKVTISAPLGREVAKRTFNPRLGIVGGISILGTSGRVKPMNEAALLESLTLELNTHAAEGRRAVAVAFAGTGEEALRKAYGIKNRAVVQLSLIHICLYTFRGLCAGYGAKKIIDGISGEIERGRITALIGPNGGGKSTLCLLYTSRCV